MLICHNAEGVHGKRKVGNPWSNMILTIAFLLSSFNKKHPYCTDYVKSCSVKYLRDVTLLDCFDQTYIYSPGQSSNRKLEMGLFSTSSTSNGDDSSGCLFNCCGCDAYSWKIWKKEKKFCRFYFWF